MDRRLTRPLFWSITGSDFTRAIAASRSTQNAVSLAIAKALNPSGSFPLFSTLQVHTASAMITPYTIALNSAIIHAEFCGFTHTAIALRKLLADVCLRAYARSAPGDPSSGATQ
jgi:hypothetical protein